jgi:hypothetical protein
LRFDDPRVMALARALAVTAHLIGGFTDRSLRPLVAGLLDAEYSQAHCCYDLPSLAAEGAAWMPALECVPHYRIVHRQPGSLITGPNHDLTSSPGSPNGTVAMGTAACW